MKSESVLSKICKVVSKTSCTFESDLYFSYQSRLHSHKLRICFEVHSKGISVNKKNTSIIDTEALPLIDLKVLVAFQ